MDLETLLQVAADEMNVDVASLYVYEEPDLVLQATFGLSEESVGRVRMQTDDGLTGLTFSSGRPLPVSDPATHPRYRYFPESGESEFHSYLGIPLPDKMGVLVFQTRAKHFYMQSEVAAAELWARRMLVEYKVKGRKVA